MPFPNAKGELSNFLVSDSSTLCTETYTFLAILCMALNIIILYIRLDLKDILDVLVSSSWA